MLDLAGVLAGQVRSPLPVQTHTARMDLTFTLAERWTKEGQPAGIGGVVEFRTDVFDPASIQTLIARFQRVLEAMTADPQRPLSSIDVLDADEHARLDDWANRAVLTRPAAPAVSIPAAFAAQVARTPEAVALTCRGPVLDVSGTGRGGESVGALAGCPRGRSGRVCGAAGGTLGARPLSRSWRSLRPARPMCQSTRACPPPGSSSWSPMPPQSP